MVEDIINVETLNAQYVLDQLLKIKRVFDERTNQSKQDFEFECKVKDLITETQNKLEEMQINKDNPIYKYQMSFYDIVNSIKEQKEANKVREKPIRIDYKGLNEKTYSKLNYLFRINKIMSYDVAKEYYIDSEMVHKKYVEFLQLINWLNDNGLSIICEKMLFSGYLNISVETYNKLLEEANEDVRNVLRNIDEGFTTQQFGALISNKKTALETIQRTKKYGQEMETTDSNQNQVGSGVVVFSIEELMKRKELIDNTSSKKNNKNVIEMEVKEG